MELALQQARMAATRGEVPVGAVLLDAQGTVLAQAGNRVEELQDPSAHAEMLGHACRRAPAAGPQAGGLHSGCVFGAVPDVRRPWRIFG
jgi:tRNA(Arg) A34 adenosine deaminase TadA